jgi:hypothetical protein
MAYEGLQILPVVLELTSNTKENRNALEVLIA